MHIIDNPGLNAFFDKADTLPEDPIAQQISDTFTIAELLDLLEATCAEKSFKNRPEIVKLLEAFQLKVEADQSWETSAGPNAKERLTRIVRQMTEDSINRIKGIVEIVREQLAGLKKPGTVGVGHPDIY
jgi:hypothetical protein